MRSLLLLAFLLVLAPVVVSTPYVGVLVWSWLSFMNPHRETFGVAYEAPIVFIAALVTLSAWLFSRQPRPIIFERTALLLILLGLWTGITTLAAIDIAYSSPYFFQTVKTIVLALVVMALINSKTRVQGLIWVIAISIGYYAVKGGGFTLLGGSGSRVFGPEHSAIGDNNHLGAALAMTLPLLNYLRLSSRHVIVSAGVTLVMLAAVVAIFGTYSRGGLVALVIVGAAMWLRSRHKLILTIGAGAILLAVPLIVTTEWYERMSSIEVYSRDASFQGRVEAWGVSTRLALDRPLTGGGFYAAEIDSVSRRYSGAGPLLEGRGAHSIYFQVLGDHGFIGLGLYVSLLIVAFLNLNSVASVAKRSPELAWLRDLAAMLQVALIGILSAGALLSMAYYDVLIVLVALSAGLRLLVREPEALAAAGATWRRNA